MAMIRDEATREMEARLAKVYAEGKAAQIAGLGIEACPYPMLSLNESHWIRGWHEWGKAMRRRRRLRLGPEDEGGVDDAGQDGGITIL
jgi:ribosome modulation factor